MGFPKQPFSFLITFWIGVEKGFNGVGYTLDDYARKIKCPVLLQYGSKDQLVTWEETDNLFRSLGSANKKLAVYQGVHHESLLQKDPARWKEEVGGFLERNK
jgi:alpha-beta hydrolase superfamily lysophospholipase